MLIRQNVSRKIEVPPFTSYIIADLKSVDSTKQGKTKQNESSGVEM
jgi:hypothetical protein